MSTKKRKSAHIDRISYLPYELLCRILSFLTIEQAFATTILSKRWALLCYSLSVLCFKFDDEASLDDETSLDDDGDAIDCFCRFVDTFMLSPFATNQPIKTFSLKCLSRFSNLDDFRKNFNAWVAAAKQRHVKDFQIVMNRVTLNPTIFTSQTLVVMKLEGLNVKAETLHVDLPSLKTLHLKFVLFRNKNDFMKILNACPILEDLHTSNPIYDENNEAGEFKSLFLSKLVKADTGSIDVPFNVISNVEFLCVDYIQNSTLKSIPVFRNLIHIELCFYQFSHGWDGVVELLRHCPKLQVLYMRKRCKSLSKDWKCPISALECVSSHLRSCTLLDIDGSENDLRFATYILQNARLLEVMKINVRASAPKMQNRQILEKLSSCPRMSLSCKLSF